MTDLLENGVYNLIPNTKKRQQNHHRRSQTQVSEYISSNCSQYTINQKNRTLDKIKFIKKPDNIIQESTNKVPDNPKTHIKYTRQQQQSLKSNRKFYLNHMKITYDNLVANQAYQRKQNKMLSYVSGESLRKSKKQNKNQQQKICRHLRTKVKIMTTPNYIDNMPNKKQRFEKIKISNSTRNSPKNSILVKQKKLQRGNYMNNYIDSDLGHPKKQQNYDKSRQNLIELRLWNKQLCLICKCIDELIQYGTPDKKLNKWIQNHFENKKKGYLQIFMKKIHKKKSLANQIYYQAYRSPIKLLDNIIKRIESLSDKQIYFLSLQITQYRNFLQQKIASKNCIQLAQISERMKKNICSLQMKQFAQNLFAKNSPNTQILTFHNDLQNIESNYGKLNLLSIKNRKRFQYINTSQVGLKEFLS